MRKLVIILLFCSVAQAANDFSEDANCVALWKHETGALQTDTMGLNNLVTNANVSATATHKEGSYAGQYTAASTAYQEIPDVNLSADFPGKDSGAEKSFSIALWARFDSLPAESGYHQQIFTKGCRSGDSDEDGFQLETFRYGENSFIRVHFVDDDTHTSNYEYTSTSMLATGRWYHLAVTYNDSTKAYHVRAYDDTAGAIWDDFDGTVTDNSYVNTQPVRLGVEATSDWGQNYLDGQLDEVVVFNRVLDSNEIDSIRQGVYPSSPAPNKATGPDPADEATDVEVEATTAWTSGGGEDNFNVYFGTDATPDETELIGNQDANSYDPGTLAAGTDYYWRIDPNSDAGGATTGDVWHFTTGWSAGPATYYVDDANGSDSYHGRSTALPFKTIAHALSVVTAGDTIEIRDGTYAGPFSVQDIAGTDGNSITVKNYGSESPILTTSVVVTGWVQCTAEDANLIRGEVVNPHATSIYMCKVPDDTYGLYRAGLQLPIASDPNMSYADWYRVEEMRDIPDEGGNFGGQDDYIVDSTYLTQADDYWNGAKVVVWSHGANNWLKTAVVVDDFNSVDHKLIFATPVGTNLTDSGSLPDRYVIENHPMILDKAGEWCTVQVDSGWAIYCWPTDANDLETGMRRSAATDAYTYGGGSCIYATAGASGSYMKWEGLTIQNSLGGLKYTDCGTVTGIEVNNVTVKQGKGVGLYLYNLASATIVDCNIVNSNDNGIQLSGTGIQVTGCNVEQTLSTGIYSAGAEQLLIEETTIGETGTHGNGIALYQSTTDALIAHCTITTPKVSITISEANGVTIWGNIIYGGTSGLADWGGSTGQLVFAHNTILSTTSIPYGEGGASATSTTTLRVVDNILTASTFASATTAQYNVYTGTPGHDLGTGEVVQANLAAIFTDPNGHDYTLIHSGPADNIGGDPSGYAPDTIFTAFDFTVDRLGATWSTDAGAYALAAGEPSLSYIAILRHRRLDTWKQ